MKKKILLTLMTLMAIGSTFPALAATRKPIKTVSLEINAEILFGAGLEENDIEVEIGALSDRYAVDSYEFINEDVEWDKNSVPEMEITLTAAEDHYFSLSKASAVKLKGNADAEYKGGKKRDSSTTLILSVKLNCIANGVGEVVNIGWDKTTSGLATWESISINETEIILYREDKKLRTIREIPETQNTYDLSLYMTQVGDYTYWIRGFNPVSGKKGEWGKSESYFLTADMEKINQRKLGYQSLDDYGWQQDGRGWWYKTPGGYRQNEWVLSNEHWFYLDAEGYMVTGWNLIDGSWYYFNPNGERMENMTDQEGYIFDENGVCLNP